MRKTPIAQHRYLRGGYRTTLLPCCVQMSQLKASLRREDEAALLVTADVRAPRTGDDIIEVASRSCYNTKKEVSERHQNSGSAGKLADSDGDNGSCAGGVGVVGWTQRGARRVFAARASKLVRAEADAYADVQVCVCVCV